jgi:hypothetical protein
MNDRANELLKAPANINGWNLFWIVTAPISIAVLIATVTADLSSGEGVSSLVQFSVRCAVPLLFVVFAASSIQVLFPGSFGRWLLRNRKYLGLSFAAAMAWQALFILWLVIGHTGYYVEEVYVLRDAIEGVIGYMFLLAMTATSFPRGRIHVSRRQWRILHLSGIYFLWAYAFSTYWWALFHYPNPVFLDYVFYASGLSAWTLRAAAWGRRRSIAAAKAGAAGNGRPPFRMAGVVLIGIGLAISIFGSAWKKIAAASLYGYGFTSIPELYLPFWPFEPFLPLAVMLGGIYLTTLPASGATSQPTTSAAWK